MKVIGLGNEDKYAEENDDSNKSINEKKKKTKELIVNLFEESTIIKIRRVIEKYNEILQSKEMCQRYPILKDGLYEYLEIKDIENAKQFTELMLQKGKEIFAIRQERGSEYVPLVDLFNALQIIGTAKDVIDNINEFKLLLKYPNLSSYMFSFVEMKPSTLKRLVDIAKKEYSFKDEVDFLLNYYIPIHDNFGISDDAISNKIKKAKKKAILYKITNNIDEKLGRNKVKRQFSIGKEIIYWLMYFPIYITYLIFEIIKSIFKVIHRLAIPFAIGFFIFENLLLPIYDIDNMLILKKIFNKKEWTLYLSDFYDMIISNAFQKIVLTITLLIIYAIIYILPTVYVYLFTTDLVSDFNKHFDWIGIERTFKKMFEKLRDKTDEQYQLYKQMFLKKNIFKIITNIICIAILTIILLII